MPYADPQSTHNPTAGQVAPAAWGDAVRDVGEYLARNKPRCRARRTTTQAITTSTATSLLFDSERYDTGGCHSTSSNTNRITVPSGEGGLYHIFGWAQFASDATGFRSMWLIVNATTTIAQDDRNAVNGAQTSISLSTDYALAAGDYVELQVWHTKGSNLNIAIGAELGFRWVAL